MRLTLYGHSARKGLIAYPIGHIKTAEQRTIIQQYGDWYIIYTLVVDGCGCYIWYSEEGPGRARALPSPLLTVLHVTE